MSEGTAHEPSVDDATFTAVPGIGTAKNGETRRHVLAGLVVCGVCDRRMDGHRVHGHAGYRCRHGYTSAGPRPARAPRNVYAREEHLLDALPGLLEVDGGDTASKLIEQLAERGLEIVCTHHNRGLRPSMTQRRANVLTRSGRGALHLG
ncbi:zinc ribbon domain-containing protein [Actinokineospora sp. PR83]|uniref:zinc ribbon domain-containing protein n=1 Tax=Actinokineospora sp. PR83 TaxID=2884908 RepID=UPI0027E0729B|nr:zinc ribbon domain-containing protein [Actinokineospora sp. PR83]MCG8915545.1 zinc ribbon domain-containing protein [Actinokineospora sp. PR83]